jgi:ATP-dependent DNA helicase RecQ
MVNSAEKKARVLEMLEERVPEDGASVVYCATRVKTEEMAEWLQHNNLSAEAFHAGLVAPEKKRIQDGFIAGDIDHICATNAFGMGIDKENVRLVVHADIPGSLENYLQEAGRAGRDSKSAQCVLLYDERDIETQFSLSASSRLTRYDIAQILRGLRRSKQDEDNNVVVTSGEILRDEEVDTSFDTDDPMATTKVNTAVSVLERGTFVERNENRTNVIQVSPLSQTLEEAHEKIERLDLSARVKRQWKEIMGQLFNRDPNQPLSADRLAELPSMTFNQEFTENKGFQNDTLPVLRILNDMVNAGLVKKDTLLSAYVKVRGKNASDKILSEVCALETAMIEIMQEMEPDPEDWADLSLRTLNQRLVDDGHTSAPESLRSLLRSLAMDGQGLAGRQGSIALKYRDKDHYSVKLQRSWSDLKETAERRHQVASVVMNAIVSKIPDGSSGELLVEFGESDLLNALKSDMFISAKIYDPGSAIERGLLFLHEQRCIIIQQGLAVFRSAMTIRILPGAKGRRFTDGDFSSLKEHYRERNFQIHVMNRYASLGLDKIQDAVNLSLAYFTLDKRDFVERYFPGDEEMLERATSAESYQSIVDELDNCVQVSVVSARKDSNMLVLAGPGSGKTRVIAHRCAYLLRVERVRPREILVVCFNRAAATSLRKRIYELVGKDAAGVTVQTYHGLAMRLAGASLTAHLENNKETLDLDSLIPQATAMLRGECDIPGLKPDEMRERLLAGYRHILIDEYQDIDKAQYEMISAIAGRTLDSENDDAKLSILAVGDDDQSIYAFRGANVRFIRQFEKDYEARLFYLVENYRSTRNIIDVSNQLIALNHDRMKTEHPIQINKARSRTSPGDPIRIIKCLDEPNQARHVLQEIINRSGGGERIAVLSRTNDELDIIRAALESSDIPSSIAAERKKGIPLHRLREFQRLIKRIMELDQVTVTAEDLRQELLGQSETKRVNPWNLLLNEFLIQWREETNNYATTPGEAVDFLYEATQEYRHFRGADHCVYLSTVYAAKGLEFDHVFILGKWTEQHSVEKQEEERRPYYVGMTRARKTLTLCELVDIPNPNTSALQGKAIERHVAKALTEPSDEELSQCYSLLDLTSVWIDYPAVAKDSDVIRRKITELETGSTVTLEKLTQGGRVSIVDNTGYKIGLLSEAASSQWEGRLESVRSAQVHSIITWRKDFSERSNDDYPDEWEVPLIEVVWVK